MKKEEIINAFYTSGLDKPYNKNKNKDKQLVAKLKKLTSYLNDNATTSERLYCLKNNTKPNSHFNKWKNQKPVKEILEDIIIEDYFKEQVTSVLENRQVTRDRMKNLAFWVKYRVEDDYLKRFDTLLKHPKNDSTSETINILRYGEKEGLRRFEEKNRNCCQTEENMIKKYGRKEGLKRWNEYRNKISFANSEKGYIAKYGEIEGKKKFKKQCERNSGNLTLERKIELHGEEEGKKKFNEMTEVLQKRHSLENYIRIYGEEEGAKKWNEICAMRSYKNSLAHYIEKYGEKEGRKRIKKVKNQGIHMNNFSKSSLKLFDNLSFYSDKYGPNEEVISLTEKEYDFCGTWNIKPDFIFKNKIIEFNGDRFHANPNLFDDDDNCHPFYKDITAKELREKDNKRNTVLKNKGYEIKIVWESDFLKDNDSVIKECKKFLDS